MEYLKGKKILITGGTGSFGKHIVKKLIGMKPESVTIFSRDEEKQHKMEIEFEDHADLLNFVIGDVRDYSRVLDVSRDIDVIYHAAAMKQVPRCEYNPMEAVKTNVIGAFNVKTAAVQNNVERVIAISTDKAVKPVNVMGMTKAIQERLIISDNSNKGDTKFTCVRYGNVIGSRGSVIPYFKDRIDKDKFIPVTHPGMTRFLLSLDDAIDLVFEATSSDKGLIIVKKAPSCKIIDLANVIAREMGNGKTEVKTVGLRPGEKLHEVLVSEDEMTRSIESDNYYTIHQYGSLIEPKIKTDLPEYTSYNTKMLDEEEIKQLLQKTGWLK